MCFSLAVRFLAGALSSACRRLLSSPAQRARRSREMCWLLTAGCSWLRCALWLVVSMSRRGQLARQTRIALHGCVFRVT